MILSVRNISKSFADNPVLKEVSFHVEDREKAALVGINGSGKSTLLKIIVGELSADEGTVTFARDISVGYLAQYQEAFGDRSVYGEVLEGKRELLDMEAKIRAMEGEMQSVPPEEAEEFLEKYHRLLREFEAGDGYSYASEVTGVLKGLGFAEPDFNKRCSELSGGQKTRVALARLLVSRPDILLLDEPTNHLDIASIRWLENFLTGYRGAVLVVSHDRYFLDRVVTKVVEISLGRATVRNGNYTYYAVEAAKRREELKKAWENQQREIRRQEEVIEKLRSFNREKSVKRAESREKLLAKRETVERPQEERSRMKITFTPAVLSGKDVLIAEGLAKSYGSRELFKNLSFDLRRGEHVALIGENGTGKTTILKILNRVIDADDGMFKLGANVEIGYYDQEQQDLNDENTLFGEIADLRPELTQTQVRNILAAFLFTGDEVFSPVGSLSGGERARISLAKMMLSEANFLILDEPTNHLDIVSREILESAINSYEGTVLFVSHDRYFINRTAGRILELENGALTNYPGDYDYYLEKKEELKSRGNAAENAGGREEDSAAKAEWQTRKEEQSRQRSLRNRILRDEEEIEKLEMRLGEIEEAFSDPLIATDPVRLEELGGEQAGLKEKLERLYAEWEALSEEQAAGFN